MKKKLIITWKPDVSNTVGGNGQVSKRIFQVQFTRSCKQNFEKKEKK